MPRSGPRARPRIALPWFAVVCALAVLALLALGGWQLQRLAWKRDLLARIELGLAAPPAALPAALRAGAPATAAAYDYRRVRVSGRLLPQHTQRLSPRLRDRQPGAHLLTPLQMEDGRVLLVNRGWVPGGWRLPVAADGQAVSLTGVLRSRFRKGAFVPDHQPGSDQWHWYDLDGIAAATGLALLPAVLEADAAAGQAGPPFAGVTVLDIPNNHLQYALTWFALAGVVIVMCVVYLRQQRRAAA